MDQKPSVGRIVHYVSYGTPGGEYSSECRAAIITAVNKETLNDAMERIEVDLCILNPTGMFFAQKCVYYPTPSDEDGTPQGGTWHWPERV